MAAKPVYGPNIQTRLPEPYHSIFRDMVLRSGKDRAAIARELIIEGMGKREARWPR